MSRKSDVFNKTWTLLPDEDEDEEPSPSPTDMRKEVLMRKSQLHKPSRLPSPFTPASNSKSVLNSNSSKCNNQPPSSTSSSSSSASSSGSRRKSEAIGGLCGDRANTTGLISDRIFLEDMDKENFEFAKDQIDNFFTRFLVDSDNYPSIVDENVFDMEILVSDQDENASSANYISNRTTTKTYNSSYVRTSSVHNQTVNLDDDDHVHQRAKNATLKLDDNNDDLENNNNNNNNNNEIKHNYANDLDEEEKIMLDKLKCDDAIEPGTPSFNATSIPKTFDLFLNGLKDSTTSKSKLLLSDDMLASSCGNGFSGPMSPLCGGNSDMRSDVDLANSAGGDRMLVLNGLTRKSVNMKVMTSSIDTDLNKATVTNNFLLRNNLQHSSSEALAVKTSSPFKHPAIALSQPKNSSEKCLNRSYTIDKTATTPTTTSCDLPNVEAAALNILPLSSSQNKVNNYINTKFNSNESLSASEFGDTASSSGSARSSHKPSPMPNEDEEYVDDIDTQFHLLLNESGTETGPVDLGPNMPNLNRKVKKLNETFEAEPDDEKNEFDNDDAEFEPVVFNTTYTPWTNDQTINQNFHGQQPQPVDDATTTNRTMVLLNKTQDLNNNNSYEKNDLNRTRDIIDDDDNDNDDDVDNETSKESGLESIKSIGSGRRSEVIRPTITDVPRIPVSKPAATSVSKLTRVSYLPSIKPKTVVAKKSPPSAFTRLPNADSLPKANSTSSVLSSNGDDNSTSSSSSKIPARQTKIPQVAPAKSRFGFTSASVTSNGGVQKATTTTTSIKLPTTRSSVSTTTTSSKLEAATVAAAATSKRLASLNSKINQTKTTSIPSVSTTKSTYIARKIQK